MSYSITFINTVKYYLWGCKSYCCKIAIRKTERKKSNFIMHILCLISTNCFKIAVYNNVFSLLLRVSFWAILQWFLNSVTVTQCIAVDWLWCPTFSVIQWLKHQVEKWRLERRWKYQLKSILQWYNIAFKKHPKTLHKLTFVEDKFVHF